MTWEDQGRQDHGWFGNGTGAKEQSNRCIRRRWSIWRAGSPRTGGDLWCGGRVAEGLRNHPVARPDAKALERLTRAMIAWARGAGTDMARFAERFFGRSADDPVVAKLWAAATLADRAQSHADLGTAATDLADAQRLVGLDRWARFVADAERRTAEVSPVTTFQPFNSRSGPFNPNNSVIPTNNNYDHGNVLLTGSQDEAVPGAAIRSLRGLQGLKEPGGQWVTVSEGMSARASAYQIQVSGSAAGRAYVVNGVRFDGFNGKALLEAKGPGYAQWVSSGRFKDTFYGQDGLIGQARRQAGAANGFPIEWHVTEPEAVAAMRQLLKDARIDGITVLHVPVAP